MTQQAKIARLIQDELKARGSNTDLIQHLFPIQRSIVQDPAKYKLVSAGRRAGKTTAMATALYKAARKWPRTVALFIAPTRDRAKSIIWGMLKEVNEGYRLSCEFDEAELTVKIPNGSRIVLSGAANRAQVEKKRGDKLCIVVIDESPLLPEWQEKLVNEVLVPSLMDVDGEIILSGSPLPVKTGFFWRMMSSGKWKIYSFNAKSNPNVNVDRFIERECERLGVGLDSPMIRREIFGEWIDDTDALVLHFNKLKNIYKGQVRCANTVMGIDLGVRDADAIAVLGYDDDAPHTHLLYEDIAVEQSITALSEKLVWVAKEFGPHRIVADTGGLGLKVVNDLMDRTGLFIEAADKQGKFAAYRILDAALRKGHFLLPEGSRAEEDSYKLAWDREDGDTKVSDRFHSDILDAILYAYRGCRSYDFTLREPALDPDAHDYHERLAAKRIKEEIAESMRRVQAMKDEHGVIDMDDMDAW